MEKTTRRVIKPIIKDKKLSVKDLAIYEELDFGKWEYGEGQPNEPKYELMEDGYVKPKEPGNELLSFAVITDIHITDKESPVQVLALGLGLGLPLSTELKKENMPFLSAYSPVSLYSTQVLNAAIGAVNELNKLEPLDFLISLGDNCNNSQSNELDWFIDVLDKKKVYPYSGGNLGKENIDYQKPYESVGLNIPWYQAIGNHDQFITGVFPVDDKAIKTLTGDSIVSLSPDIMINGDFSKSGYYMGVFDGLSPIGNIIGVGPETNSTGALKITSDCNRKSLVTEKSYRKEFMEKFLKSTSEPLGHGFNQKNIDDDFACYSFYPKANIPLKIIVMDDTNPEGETTEGDIWMHGHGSLDKKRLDFLEKELKMGQASDELMLVMAHIPVLNMEEGTPSGWWLNSPVTQSKLVEILHKYPNFIAWIGGHNHRNTVVPADIEDKSGDKLWKEKSFWAVENTSLRDFPQQFREVRLFYNTDGTLSLTFTSIDFDTTDYPLAEKSRKAAIASAQMMSTDIDPGNNNVELFCTLTQKMQNKLADINVKVGQQLLKPQNGWKRCSSGDSNISYSGNWKNSERTDARYKYEKIGFNNVSLKFNFTGNKIRLFSYAFYNQHSKDIKLIIDGKIYSYSNTILNGEGAYYLDFQNIDLTNSEHSLYIENLDTTSTYTALDIQGIDIDVNGELKPYNPK